MTKTTTSSNPAPDSYTIKSDVELNKTKSKGFQFGVSRDVRKFFFQNLIHHLENVVEWDSRRNKQINSRTWKIRLRKYFN